jgi:CBS domain containing-hemolysin-like protein
MLIDFFLILFTLLLLVSGNGFFVAAEFSLVSIRKTRIQQFKNEHRIGANALEDAVNNLDSYIATCQLGITIFSLALGWIGEEGLSHIFSMQFGNIASHSLSVFIMFTIITAMHVILGELAPKGFALQNIERTALFVSPPLKLFRFIFKPFIWLLNESGWKILSLFKVERGPIQHTHINQHELRLLIKASAEAGVLHSDEKMLLDKVLRFSELNVADVLIPRTEMIAISKDDNLDSIRSIAFKFRHSRYPVFDEDLDSIVGVLHVGDLYHSPSVDDWKLLLREPLMIPAQIDLNELIVQMRQRHTQFAIVVDEYGGTDGLVTLQDVIDEIFGEILDDFQYPKYDKFFQSNLKEVLLDGLDSVDLLFEKTGIIQTNVTVKTVAGFFLEYFGKIPRVNDKIYFEKWELSVKAMDGLRIAKLSLIKIDETSKKD